MPAFRFLCDELVNYVVFVQLRDRGLDIEHILANGMARTPDPEVLRYAQREGWILLTRNYRDFAPLVERWVGQVESFPGVLFLPTSLRQADVGAHVRAVESWVERAACIDNPVQDSYGWLS